MVDEMTNDLLYTYQRKTTINDKIFKFEFEFDLSKEINEIDLADMIIYCCQRDIKLQEIFVKYNFNEQTGSNEILLIVNDYRKILLKLL